MGTTPRRPLPPGVYWRRRAFVGLLVVALVFVGVNLLRGGSDGSSDQAPEAQQVAGEVEASHTLTAEPAGQPTKKQGKKNRKKQQQSLPSQGPTFDPEVLADPEGTCSAGDILVRPQVEEAVAGRDVTIGLSLQTQQSEACTWKVLPKRLAVKIVGKQGPVWTSQECRDAVPKQEVVIRRAIATVVEMTWDARESEPGCPELTDWLLPGKFRVQAATLGGEPHRSTFELTEPEPRTIKPKPKQGQQQEEPQDSQQPKKQDKKQDERREQGQAGAT